MNIVIREFCTSDITQMIAVWNAVVEEGVAFPQTEALNANSGLSFFLPSLLRVLP